MSGFEISNIIINKYGTKKIKNQENVFVRGQTLCCTLDKSL